MTESDAAECHVLLRLQLDEDAESILCVRPTPPPPGVAVRLVELYSPLDRDVPGAAEMLACMLDKYEVYGMRQAKDVLPLYNFAVVASPDPDGSGKMGVAVRFEIPAECLPA